MGKNEETASADSLKPDNDPASVEPGTENVNDND